MSRTELRRFFDERNSEVLDYLAFLEDLESASKDGAPKFDGADRSMSAPQINVLRSTFYLQLYNMVEAVISQSLTLMERRIVSIKPLSSELSEDILREWLRWRARTDDPQSPSVRLSRILSVVKEIHEGDAVEHFECMKGGGGNWSDDEVQDLLDRLGCDSRFSPGIYKDVKRHVRDEMGSLKLIRDRRNGLAHGRLSFAECGSETSTSGLSELAMCATAFLNEYVEKFDKFLVSGIVKRDVG